MDKISVPLVFGTPAANDVAAWIRSKEREERQREEDEREEDEDDEESVLYAYYLPTGELCRPGYLAWPTPNSLKKTRT